MVLKLLASSGESTFLLNEDTGMHKATGVYDTILLVPRNHKQSLLVNLIIADELFGGWVRLLLEILITRLALVGGGIVHTNFVLDHAFTSIRWFVAILLALKLLALNNSHGPDRRACFTSVEFLTIQVHED